MHPGTTSIPLSQVEFHPSSYVDPNGRLFWRQGGLYRGITKGRGGFYRRLFQDGLVQSLVERGLLVETELTELALDGYELVLRHRVIPFVSYAPEWCAQMLKDAALLVVDLEIELAKHDLTLQDAHPWNVLFDGPTPVYVDFGSIKPARSDAFWEAHDEFCRFFLYPLQLMAHGHGRIARWLLWDYHGGVFRAERDALLRTSSLASESRKAARRLVARMKRLVPSALRPLVKRPYRLLRSALSRPEPSQPDTPAECLQRLRDAVERVSIPSPQEDWSADYDGGFPSLTPCEEWTPKHRGVYEILSDLRPETLLDVASNRGWYAQLAAVLGSKVVAFDTDETCIAQLWSDAKRQNLPVLPLLMEFRKPSPSLGLGNVTTSAMERLRCDMVLALHLVHNLVFKQNLRFDRIVEGLAAFSKRALLVEFLPRDDVHVREWWSAGYSWYTLESFIEALRRRFHRIEVLPSNRDPRVLLLCERGG